MPQTIHTKTGGIYAVADAKNALALLYLAASMAPSLYLPPLFLVLILMLGLGEFALLKNPNAHAPYAVPMAALVIFSIIVGLLSGLKILDIISYDAIRYDANLLYSCLPAFFLGSGRMSVAVVYRWIKSISVVAIFVYLLSPAVGFIPFESHNAAGGFFMILLAYLLARAITVGRKGFGIAVSCALVGLVASDSRGSIVAVGLAVLYFLLQKKRPKLAAVLLVGLVISFVGFLAICYFVWQANGSLYLYDYLDFGPASETIDFSALSFGERAGTVLHRVFFLYPMAIDMFLHSPLIGVGFTRFDDFPAVLHGLSGVVMFNSAPYANHSNLHAHNSYLHILAETGILGFFLLMIFLKRAIRCVPTYCAEHAPIKIVLGTLLVASLTEHRLTTPSQAAPAFILIALMWASARTSNFEHRRAERSRGSVQ